MKNPSRQEGSAFGLVTEDADILVFVRPIFGGGLMGRGDKAKMAGSAGTQVEVEIMGPVCHVTVTRRGEKPETFPFNEDEVIKGLGPLASKHGCRPNEAREIAVKARKSIIEFWRGEVKTMLTYVLDTKYGKDIDHAPIDLEFGDEPERRYKVLTSKWTIDRLLDYEWLLDRARIYKTATEFENRFDLIVRQYQQPAINAATGDVVGIITDADSPIIWSVVLDVDSEGALLEPLGRPQTKRRFSEQMVTKNVKWFWPRSAKKDPMRFRLFWYMAQDKRLSTEALRQRRESLEEKESEKGNSCGS